MSSPLVGQGIDRVDGKLKVCGRAPFAAEFVLPNLTHGVLVTSTAASSIRMRTGTPNPK